MGQHSHIWGKVLTTGNLAGLASQPVFLFVGRLRRKASYLLEHVLHHAPAEPVMFGSMDFEFHAFRRRP